MAKYKVTVNQGSRLPLYGGAAGGTSPVIGAVELIALHGVRPVRGLALGDGIGRHCHKHAGRQEEFRLSRC